MKSLVLILMLLVTFNLAAQRHSSDEMAVILSIKSDNGKPLANQAITAYNAKDDERHKLFTKTSGRVTFILRRGQTYQISFLDFKNHTTIKVPLKGMNFLTKKIIFTASNLQDKGIVGLDTIRQDFKRKVSSTKSEALLTLLIKDKRGNRIPNQKIWLTQKKIKKVYHATTNEKGAAAFLLPIGYTYQLNFEKDANYRRIEIPKIPFQTRRKGITYHSSYMNIKEWERNDTIFQEVPLSQNATKDRVLLQVTVLSLDDEPLENEKVFMVGKEKVYTATTDQDGRTAMMLPKDKQYNIRFEYSGMLENIFYKKGNYVQKDKVTYKYIGSKAMKERNRKRARMAVVRDSLMQIQAFRDSLNRKRSKWSGFTMQIARTCQKPDISDAVYNRAREDSIGISKDPKYFETIGDEINAALYRNKDKWKNKIIVTDMTCSMYSYLDQVLVWHVLEMNKAQFKQEYIFFNDGDGKPMSEKITGMTGGFHHIQSKNIDDLTWTIKETMQTGCSIDGPENDLEALLEAVKYRDNLQEIILIADNSSPVRDIELLTQLNVPIRIVLAGVWYSVNEEYLEIAYHTKGSVHTLKEDIDHLYKMNDGEYIKIDGENYRVYNGKFLKIDKM